VTCQGRCEVRTLNGLFLVKLNSQHTISGVQSHGNPLPVVYRAVVVGASKAIEMKGN